MKIAYSPIGKPTPPRKLETRLPSQERVDTIKLGAKAGVCLGLICSPIALAAQGYNEQWGGDPICGAVVGAFLGITSAAIPASAIGGLVGGTLGLALQPFFGWPPPEPRPPHYHSLKQMVDKIKELDEEQAKLGIPPADELIIPTRSA